MQHAVNGEVFCDKCCYANATLQLEMAEKQTKTDGQLIDCKENLSVGPGK
jgi:hypothetical protein